MKYLDDKTKVDAWIQFAAAAVAGGHKRDAAAMADSLVAELEARTSKHIDSKPVDLVGLAELAKLVDALAKDTAEKSSSAEGKKTTKKKSSKKKTAKKRGAKKTARGTLSNTSVETPNENTTDEKEKDK